LVPKSFEYVAPSTIDEALSYLGRFGPDSKVLAGGQSLVPLMKLRLAAPKYLIDINRIPDLEYIREEKSDGKEELAIGALTRHHAIEASDLIKSKASAMSEAASMIGDPQVRNYGTIGGSLVHADPAADWGAVAIALGATLRLVSSKGPRVLMADHFFVGALTCAAEPSELLTEIKIPLESPPLRTGSAYAKLERKTQDFATVGVAAKISLNDSGVCEKVGIGLASVAETSMRATKAEASLVGSKITRAKIEEAAEEAAGECRPTDDILRGSAEYKRAMARVFTERALTSALKRAENKM